MQNIDLDNILIGRVKPSIYAFETEQVPDSIKIGDTIRPVSVRLNEWRTKYPDLVKRFETEASVGDEVFFRDYQVHNFLIETLKRENLSKNAFPPYLYYSNEFFKNTSIDDVQDAIQDIRNDYQNGTGKYSFYDSSSLHIKPPYASEGEWYPYLEQQMTIDKFVKAYNSGRRNLLMYAVMRFGKSFTSLCCAKEIKAKFVVVVSDC